MSENAIRQRALEAVPQLVLELVLETDDLRHAEGAEVDHRNSRPEGTDCDGCRAAAVPPGRPPR
jgi:hypothetical protein